MRAVGYQGSGTELHTLTEHREGNGWTLVNSPSPSVGSTELLAVDGTGADSVWAVGYSVHGTDYRTRVQYWNGTAWASV
jgi:hypothetical protein